MNVLVAGVGNVFRRDDGFGPEVARRMLRGPERRGVTVRDYGVSTMHLALDSASFDLVVIVDAAPLGEDPGTVAVVEPSGLRDRETQAVLDGHGADPSRIVELAASVGSARPTFVVVGCQPHDIGDGIGLTGAVAAAVDRAVEVVDDLIAEKSGAVA